jgi:hypothetical protein
MDRIIQSYIDYLSDVKLKNEYNNLIQKRNIISKDIYDIISQNPQIIGKSVEHQIGGNLTEADVEKVKKLKTLFDAYKESVGEKDLLPNIDQVKQILTSLKQNVENASGSLKKLVAPQYLPQDLELVLTSLNSNTTSPDGFFEKMNGLYKIKLPDITNDENFKKYIKLKDRINRQIDNFTAQVKDIELTDGQLAQSISDEINKEISIIQTDTRELMQIKTEYELQIKTIVNSFKNKVLFLRFFDPNDKAEKDIDDTERVYNQLLVSQGTTQQLEKNVSDLLNDIEVESIDFSIKGRDVSKIYDADFKINDKGEAYIESKYNKKTLVINGGFKKDLMERIISLQKEANIFKKLFDDYKVVFSEYNYLQIKNIK